MSDNRTLCCARKVVRKVWFNDEKAKKHEAYPILDMVCDTRHKIWGEILANLINGKLGDNVYCSIQFMFWPPFDPNSPEIADEDALLKCGDCFQISSDSISRRIKESVYYAGQRRRGGFIMRPASAGIEFLDRLLKSPALQFCKKHASDELVELPRGTLICRVTLQFEDLKMNIDYYPE